MVTEDMLEIYARFQGDRDGFVRAAPDADRSVVSDAQWHAIDVLLLELHAVKARLASPGYAREIETRLAAMAASPRVKEWLWQLA